MNRHTLRLRTVRSLLLFLALAAAFSGCRKDGRAPTGEAPAARTEAETVAWSADAAPEGAAVSPASDGTSGEPLPADAGGPAASSSEPVDLGPAVAHRLPARLTSRDGGLKYSTSVLAAGGGGSVVVATSSGNHAGYVFERLNAGWVETLRFELAVLETHGGRERVAVSGDGDTLVLAVLESHDCPGGTCPARGAVALWDRRPGGWARLPDLPVSDEVAFQGFGLALAIDEPGDALAVATLDEPAVFVFERAGEAWRQAAKLEGTPRGFGASLAFSGGRLAVGAPGREDSEGGAVELFERREGEWTPASRIAGPDGSDRTFGGTVALAGDVLVAGGYGIDVERGGAAFAFERGEDGWAQTARLEPREEAERRMFGRGVVAWADGRAIAVQSLTAVHFFVRDGSAWVADEFAGVETGDEARAVAPAGPMAAVLTVSDVLLRVVPGIAEGDTPETPLRPAPVGPPDCSRARACARPCERDEDCCASAPCPPGMWASTCVGSVCTMTGCASDDECSSIPGARCFQGAEPGVVHGICAPACSADADCQPPYRCRPGGACGLEMHNVTRCYSDLDCARRSGMEHCDVDSGCCECDDAACARPPGGGVGMKCVSPTP